MPGLRDDIVQLIRRDGPMPFDRFMELALYDPGRGYFAGAGTPVGRRGDFITSPEVGPLFGAVIANALDAWWHRLGEPDPYTVIDAGAGPGTLARSVVAAEPECADALTYLEVEHHDVWPLFPFTGVILANELLDNLPFRVLERAGPGWTEVTVGIEGGDLVEVTTPLAAEVAEAAEQWAPRAPVGARIPWPERAARWVDDALDSLIGGRLLVIDYGAATARLAEREGGWLRTYRGHERGRGPLDDIGAQDITADVAIDQVTDRRTPTTVTTQADLLRSHGIDELVEEGRAIWMARAHLGDLEAVRGRSRVREAEALLDPEGLGGFIALQWDVQASR